MHRLTFRQGIAPLCAALLLGACRSPQISLVAPPPPPPVNPVAVAPAVPLSQVLDLHRMVESQLENYYAKRADRLGRAVEPEERGLFVQLHSNRLDRDFTPLEAFFNAGEELFEFEFTVGEGLGNGLGAKPPNMRRVHRGAQGGPDTTSCRSCHHRGGDDGAGEYTEAALTGGDGENVMNANERNAPALLGGGALQILAREISEALAAQAAPVKGVEGERRLEVQGVDFGTVRMRKDGTLDTSKLTAIDPDLIVRPFGWKGTHSTLRRFAEEAFQVHHGLQSESLVERRAGRVPLPPGASPATRALLGALGDGPAHDPDRDGNALELNARMLTSVSVYLTLLPLPVIEPPRAPDLLAAFRDGEVAFRDAGCPSCHKPSWMLQKTTWTERGEASGEKDQLVLDLRKDIQRGPQLRNTNTMTYGAYPLYIFSDLRRHDMGPELADTYDGGPHKGDRKDPDEAKIPPSYFLTRPLWGLADSAPYLHDGRAVTIPDAITLHGGEARASREAYLKLPPERQRALHVFLLSLTRPPVPEVVP
jgi:hypothetical protein